MLSQWSKNAAWFVDTQLRAAGMSAPKDKGGDYVINLDVLRGILPSLSNNTLQHVVGLCGETIAPIYSTLSHDVETITGLLLELETSYDTMEGSTCEPEPTILVAPPHRHQESPLTRMSQLHTDSAHKSRAHTKRRRSACPAEIPIIIPSTHPSAPSIMISPCGSHNHERTCRVPYQNSSFGNLLTVPSHPSYNEVHPPMLLSPSPLPLLEDWEWRDGHWGAVLPCLQQQTRRGLFSRMYSARRRSHRPCGNEH